VHSSYRPSNYPAEKPFQSPGRFTAPTPFAIYSPGAPVDITFDWRAGEQPVNTVTMYYETEPIALLSNAPWATVISNPPSGPHGITATAALQIGTEKHSFQIFTVQTPDAPERPTELCAAPHAAANIKLAWRDNANDEAGFLIERRPADCFAWEPVATISSNMTRWFDTTVIAGSSYVYRVFAFNHNDRSRLGNEARATAGVFTWAGRTRDAGWTSQNNWLYASAPPDGAAVLFPCNSLLSPYTSGRTVNLNKSVSIREMTFENGALDVGGLCVKIADGASLQIANDGWFRQSGAAANVLSGAVALAGGTVGCDIENGALTFAGNIAGAAALAKSGAGTLVLAGSNSYSGGTWIEAGRVLAVGTGGSACGTGPVHVGAGALLGGDGTILGVVSNAGVISPGASTGTLSMTALVQGPDAVLRCELGARGHDQLDVAGDVHLAGTLQLQNTSNLFGTFTLISYGGTLTMDELTLDGLPGDVEATLLTNQVGSVTLRVTPKPRRGQ
jgi:autotransporter-associated beta strand protein